MHFRGSIATYTCATCVDGNVNAHRVNHHPQVGRSVPKAANETDVSFKSRTITLPQQGVAANKASTAALTARNQSLKVCAWGVGGVFLHLLPAFFTSYMLALPVSCHQHNHNHSYEHPQPLPPSSIINIINHQHHQRHQHHNHTSTGSV